jgi:HTH-type transcriptional regulator/antitoxin HigA
MAGLTLDRVEYGRLLAERLPLRVERDSDYDRLADEVEQITFDEGASAELRAYADLAAELLAAYDRRPKAAGEEPTAADVLELLLEGRGLRQADLVPLVGSSAYVSQIMSGKRGISRAMAKKLGEFFEVDPSLFFP